MLGFNIRIPVIFSVLILISFLFIVPLFPRKKMCLFDEFSLFSIFLDFRLVRAGASHYVFWWGKSRDTLLLASSIHGMKLLRGTSLEFVRGLGNILYGKYLQKYRNVKVLKHFYERLSYATQLIVLIKY